MEVVFDHGEHLQYRWPFAVAFLMKHCAVHADPDGLLLEQTGEGLTGELGPLVGVEYPRSPIKVPTPRPLCRERHGVVEGDDDLLIVI